MKGALRRSSYSNDIQMGVDARSREEYEQQGGLLTSTDENDSSVRFEEVRRAERAFENGDPLPPADLRRLLELADPRAKYRLDCINCPGYDCDLSTPLTIAARNGFTDLVERLIPVSDIDGLPSEYDFCRLPLFAAVSRGHVECVKILLAWGDGSEDSHSPRIAVQGPCSPVPPLVARAATNIEMLRVLLPFCDPKLVNFDHGFFDANLRGGTALMRAAACAHFEAIEMLLPVSDPNATGSNGMTALMFAIGSSDRGFGRLVGSILPNSEGWQEYADGEDRPRSEPDSDHSARALRCIDFLRGASDLSIKDNEGCDALLIATKAARADRVAALLPFMKPDSRDRFGRDGLMLAAMTGNVDCLNLWLPLCDPLAVDARQGTPEANREMFGEPCQRTALHFTAERGSLDCVKALLAAGADPNAIDSRGATPALLAAHVHSVECLKLLMGELPLGKKGAAVIAKRDAALRAARQSGAAGSDSNPLSDDAIEQAKLASRERRAKALLARRQDKALARFRAWGLVYAMKIERPMVSHRPANPKEADSARLRCVRLLLPHCDTGTPARYGYTPLILAVGWQLRSEAELLLRVADPNIADREGETPLVVAVNRVYEASRKGRRAALAIATLVLAKANPDKPNALGATALMTAARNAGADPSPPNMEMLECLLAASDVGLRDEEGRSALDYALEAQEQGDPASMAIERIGQAMADREKAELSKAVAAPEGDEANHATPRRRSRSL